MSDHERIWLEPECCACDERHWCQDPDMWEHDPDGEPSHDTPTQYVRADLYAELEEKIKLLKNTLFDMSFQRGGPANIVQSFVTQMKWHNDATEHEKNLVIGNLNGFVAWLADLTKEALEQ